MNYHQVVFLRHSGYVLQHYELVHDPLLLLYRTACWDVPSSSDILLGQANIFVPLEVATIAIAINKVVILSKPNFLLA